MKGKKNPLKKKLCAPWGAGARCHCKERSDNRTPISLLTNELSLGITPLKNSELVEQPRDERGQCDHAPVVGQELCQVQCCLALPH